MMAEIGWGGSVGKESPRSSKPAGKARISSKALPAARYSRHDFQTCIEVTKKVAEHPGGCADGRLAESLGQKTTSGAYRQKLASSRLFGLIDYNRNRRVFQLTALSRRILSPTSEDDEIRARRESFFGVPLFAAIVAAIDDRWSGKLDRDNEGYFFNLLSAIGVPEAHRADVRNAFLASLGPCRMTYQSGSAEFIYRSAGEEQRSVPRVARETSTDAAPRTDESESAAGEWNTFPGFPLSVYEQMSEDLQRKLYLWFLEFRFGRSVAPDRAGKRVMGQDD